jgi:F-box interacting protein
MPDISGATVFDDLPESIITQEIFFRLQSKDVLRCGAVSRSWRGTTTSKEFLLEHHRHQPPLPLLTFPRDGAVYAFDIREAPAKRLPILKYNTIDDCSTLDIYASCDGLLLLYRPKDGFSIVNPTTHQWLALPQLTSECTKERGVYDSFYYFTRACDKIPGMYPDPHGSGEYRILFRIGESTDRNARYYIHTVGSSQKQKSKCIGPSMASGISMRGSPILLNGCLHWIPCSCPEDGLLVFDTARESFRWMSVPATARGSPTLLEMEGMLGMWCSDKRVIKIWVLQEYESEVWSLKCEIEFPVVKYWSNTLLYQKRDMLIYSMTTWLHQIHYGNNGKVSEELNWKTYNYLNPTMHWFKESLIRHTFFSKARWWIM